LPFLDALAEIIADEILRDWKPRGESGPVTSVPDIEDQLALRLSAAQ
jgi:hypothetical protein